MNKIGYRENKNIFEFLELYETKPCPVFKIKLGVEWVWLLESLSKFFLNIYNSFIMLNALDTLRNCSLFLQIRSQLCELHTDLS